MENNKNTAESVQGANPATKTGLSVEQKAQRLGHFSGSEVHKLMGARGMGKTGETYIHEKVAELLTGEPAKQDFSSAATDWGNQHELEAKLHYQSATGESIVECDTLMNDVLCGTPDGLIKEFDVGIEIKCPYNSGNHLKNLLIETQDDLKKLRPEYYWQIVSYMWLTGLDEWKFCSYDPRFDGEKRMLILKVKLDKADLALLMARVEEAQTMKNEIMKKLGGQ